MAGIALYQGEWVWMVASLLFFAGAIRAFSAAPAPQTRPQSIKEDEELSKDPRFSHLPSVKARKRDI